ncbi:MAG: extracellular solute-binding protein [Actinomycetota bacterium]
MRSLRRRRLEHALAPGVVVLLIAASCSSETDEVTTIGPTPAGTATTPATTPTTTATTAPTTSTSADAAPSASAARPAGEAARCTAPTAETPVVVWHALGNDSEQKLIELTDRFNGLGTGVTVALEKTGSYGATLALLADTPAADRPNAVLVDHRGIQDLALSGLVVPPGACDVDSGSLLPVIEATYTLNGELLALPYNVSTPVLVFDETRFAAAGLDPANPPLTLDELSSASAQIVETGVAPHGLVAWDGYGPWFITQFNSRRGELSARPDNGRSGELTTSVDFGRPEVVESFEWLVDEVDSGRAVWIGGNASGVDDLFRLVADEDNAVMTLNTSGALGDLERLLTSGAFPGTELGAGPLPGPGTGALVGGGAWWLIEQPDPADVGATMEFLSWLNAPEQHAEFAAFTGFSPITSAELEQPVLVDAWAEHPERRIAYDQLVDLPADIPRAGPVWGAGDDINRVMHESMTAVVEGTPAVDQLNRASERVTALLDAYAFAVHNS